MRAIRGATALVLATVVGACANPVFKKSELSEEVLQTETRKQEVALLQYRFKQYGRLRKIAYPLYREGVAMCGEKIVRDVGFLTRTPGFFPDKERAAAIEAFGLGDLPVLALVVEGSPAKRAGLKAGDVVVTFDDTPVRSGDASDESLENNIQAFAKTRSEVFNLTIRRAGKEMNLAIRPDTLCDYPIIYSPKEAINAYADGKKVIVTAGMMRFVDNDDELAVVIGHELAHNTMRHIEKKKSNQAVGLAAGVVLDVLAALAGVNTQGGFTRSAGNIGVQAYSQDFESEADYVGLYYVARAGFNVGAAAPFWRRNGATASSVEILKTAISHPTSPERFLRLDKTATEIKAKIAAGKPLTPELKGKAPWLEKAPSESKPGDDNPST